MAKEKKPILKVQMTDGKRIVSRLFRKFHFVRSVDGSYPARISASSMSSSRRCSMFI